MDWSIYGLIDRLIDGSASWLLLHFLIRRPIRCAIQFHRFSHWRAYWLIRWWIRWSAHWLIRRFVDWMTHWLIRWFIRPLVGPFIYPFIFWLMRWVTHRLAHLLIRRWIRWLIHRFMRRSNDCVTDSLTDRTRSNLVGPPPPSFWASKFGLGNYSASVYVTPKLSGIGREQLGARTGAAP